jgi:hypothetical protein
VDERMLEMNGSGTLKLMVEAAVEAAVEAVMLEVVVVVAMVMAAVDGKVVVVRLKASKEEGEASSVKMVVGILYAKGVEGEALR